MKTNWVHFPSWAVSTPLATQIGLGLLCWPEKKKRKEMNEFHISVKTCFWLVSIQVLAFNCAHIMSSRFAAVLHAHEWNVKICWAAPGWRRNLDGRADTIGYTVKQKLACRRVRPWTTIMHADEREGRREGKENKAVQDISSGTMWSWSRSNEGISRGFEGVVHESLNLFFTC